jgi:hypothetical protein
MNTFGVGRGGVWIDNQWLVMQALQRYMLQLSYVDRLLGQAMEHLRRSGKFDETLIILTADHGVSFRVGERRRFGSADTVGDVLPIPLLIKLPGQRQGEISDRNVETVDILPTLAAVLGAGDELWPVDGSSVFDQSTPERKQKYIYLRPAEGQAKETLPASLLTLARASTERILGLMGTSEADLYALGPLPELLGQTREQAGLDDSMLSTGKVYRPEIYQDIDPSTGLVPARIIGMSPMPEEEQPRCLALVIDGVVEATTFTFLRQPGLWFFTAIVPENTLTAAAPQIEIFDITDRVPPDYLNLRILPEIFGDAFEQGGFTDWALSHPPVEGGGT